RKKEDEEQEMETSKEMVLIKYFLCWLLILIVAEVDHHVLVHGGGAVVGLGDCAETRCKHDGPAIRFPFRLKGRQPIHCGYKGFDLSCTNDNQTVLEMMIMPSSSSANHDKQHVLVKKINYTTQEIEIHYQIGCPLGQIFYLNLSSSPFGFEDFNYTLFSCPSSVPYISTGTSYDCLTKLSPCLGNINNQTNYYALLGGYCSISRMPLVSCTKVLDYASVPDLFTIKQANILKLLWFIPDCRRCEDLGKECRFKDEFYSTQKNHTETQCYVLKGPKRPRATLRILGICALSVVAIVTGIVISYVYSSTKTEKESQLRIERFLDDYRALKPSRYSYADIKRMTNKFKDKLGQGAQGTVFKGKLSSELLVAVKILSNSNEKAGEDFINEVGTMGRIHHVNVVRLVGFCADGFIRALVYDFLPNGSLQNFISSSAAAADHMSRHDNSNFLGWDKLQDIALGIAKGIEYLHQGCDQQILHFDIKPHNVLLYQNFTPKVCDFGLAKLCSKDQIFSRNFGNVSHKSDVYSFGTLLLEMVGGRKNFKVAEDDESSMSQVYFPKWIYNLLEQDQEDLRIHIEDEGDVKIARKLAIVGLWCIQCYPLDRPSMKIVVQMLEKQDDKLIMPPNPFASTSN
ncbi:Protein kinase superfamily protein, partial [Prunus dulcis]